MLPEERSPPSVVRRGRHRGPRRRGTGGGERSVTWQSPSHDERTPSLGILDSHHNFSYFKALALLHFFIKRRLGILVVL